MARPPDPSLTAAILDATRALLAERGYAGSSIEAIAARAGVGKPAVYRRFAGKPELVVAAIARELPEMAPGCPPAPGRAEVRARLRALVEQATPADPEGYGALIGGLLAERERQPELIAAFRAHVLAPRRAVVRDAVVAGQRAGVVRADVDPNVAVDLLGGAFVARTYAGQPLDEGWRERLFAMWWRALAQDGDGAGPV